MAYFVAKWKAEQVLSHLFALKYQDLVSESAKFSHMQQISGFLGDSTRQHWKSHKDYSVAVFVE